MSHFIDDPNWPRASDWLAAPSKTEEGGGLAVLGAPLNHSISPGRCDLAPAAIRRGLARFSPFDIEAALGGTGSGDFHGLRAVDYSDVSLAELTPEEALFPLSQAVSKCLEESDAAVVLGGDNGITRPACHGLGVDLDRLGVVTLDAHLDLRDLDRGLMNGNPIRALLEDGLPGRNIVQIGVQSYANSLHYTQVARAAGIDVITCEQVHASTLDSLVSEAFDKLDPHVDAIYFDLDIDVLDRTFAPACPGARPGGLMPWQVRKAAFLAGLHPKVRAMDLVEVDPERDINECTAMVAAACLLSFASGLFARTASKPHGVN